MNHIGKNRGNIPRINKKGEIWVPLVYEDIREGMYEISNKGRIYSIKSDTILRPIKKHNGYYRVNLSSKKKGKQKEYSIHRLVAIHFIPLPEGYTLEELQVNHKKGDKSKNGAKDLEWVTSSENIKHSIAMGLQKIRYGDESNNHKYDSDLVRRICVNLEMGYSTKEIIKRLKLDPKAENLIRRIKERRHWTDISDDYYFY